MKNTAKYAWLFSRNSSFLRGLFYFAAPCTHATRTHTCIILHTHKQKMMMEKPKTKKTVEQYRNPWRQSSWSPVGSPVGRRGSMVGRICGTGMFWVWSGKECDWWMVCMCVCRHRWVFNHTQHMYERALRQHWRQFLLWVSHWLPLWRSATYVCRLLKHCLFYFSYTT